MSMVLNDSTRPSMAPEPFSHEIFVALEITVGVVIVGVLSVFGIFTNAVNIVVFYRQGIMSHSCTVCLASISVSDLCYSVLKLWTSICMTLNMVGERQEYGWDPIRFMIHTALRPALVLMMFTSGVTVFVTFERCFSVTFPFKTKSVFNTNRSLAIICCIFVVTLILEIPRLFQKTLGWVHFPNHTYSILTFSHKVTFPDAVMGLFYYIPSIIRPASIAMVILCNVVISWKVSLSQKFRNKSAPLTTAAHSVAATGERSSNVTDAQQTHSFTNPKTTTKPVTTATTTKEMKLVRMVTAVSALFVACYSFEYVNELFFRSKKITILEEGVDYHEYTDSLMSMLESAIQAINTSCNVFIYHAMSTSFRETLHSLFRSGIKK